MARRTEMAAKHKNRLDQLTRIASGYADLINLRPNWSNEHPLPRHVVDAAKDAVDRMHSYRFFGMRELRVAIAEKLERENGLKVDPETEMLVTTGGSEAIYLAIWSMIDPGDQVIMGNPGYVAGYEPNVMMAGGRVVYVPTGEERKFKIDPEAVEKSITSKTKMIVIVSPENPTGAIVDEGDLERIAEIAVTHDLLVLSDEIFEKVVYDGRKNFSVGSLPSMEGRTLTVNGFAKGYNMPGYRVGYVAGPEPIIEKMANIQLHMTVSVSEIAQSAALAALQGPQGWIEEAVRAYGMRRDLFVDGLNRIGNMRCLKPEGGFAAFPNIAEFGISSEDFSDYLLKEAHILSESGQSFFGTRSEGYIKLSFTRPREILEEALRRIEAALNKLRLPRC